MQSIILSVFCLKRTNIFVLLISKKLIQQVMQRKDAHPFDVDLFTTRIQSNHLLFIQDVSIFGGLPSVFFPARYPFCYSCKEKLKKCLKRSSKSSFLFCKKSWKINQYKKLHLMVYVLSVRTSTQSKFIPIAHSIALTAAFTKINIKVWLGNTGSIELTNAFIKNLCHTSSSAFWLVGEFTKRGSLIFLWKTTFIIY